MSHYVIYQRGQAGLTQLSEACTEAGVDETSMFGAVSDRPKGHEKELWRNAHAYPQALVSAMNAKTDLGVYELDETSLYETEQSEGWQEPPAEV